MSDAEAVRIREAAVRQAIELASKLYRFRHPTDDAGAKVFQQIMEQTLLADARRPAPGSSEESER